jgi:hypothetical protein
VYRGVDVQVHTLLIPHGRKKLIVTFTLFLPYFRGKVTLVYLTEWMGPIDENVAVASHTMLFIQHLHQSLPMAPILKQ